MAPPTFDVRRRAEPELRFAVIGVRPEVVAGAEGKAARKASAEPRESCRQREEERGDAQNKKQEAGRTDGSRGGKGNPPVPQPPPIGRRRIGSGGTWGARGK